VFSTTPRPPSTPGKNPVPIVQEAAWAPGSVWTDAKNHAPIGIRSPDRPACSQSLYRLSYPAHAYCIYRTKIFLKELRKICEYQNLIKPRTVGGRDAPTDRRTDTTKLIQWRPLIIIAVNIINRLFLSKSVVPKHSI
jgi:hypothetical protein